MVEVMRPSADCQTTFFRRFKQFGKILKKVAERSRDSGRRSRDRRPTVKQRFFDVTSDSGKFWKKSLNGHATMVEVTRPSADCQTTFFGRFKQLQKFLKTVAERSRERERERERERDRILRCILTANRWRRGNNQVTKFTRQFSRLLTPVPSLTVFHGNLPQKICRASSPMFIMGNLFPS